MSMYNEHCDNCDRQFYDEPVFEMDDGGDLCGLCRVSGLEATNSRLRGAPIAALRALKLLGAETDRMVSERIISERSGLADIWLDGKRSLAEFEESVFPIRLGGSWETQEGETDNG